MSILAARSSSTMSDLEIAEKLPEMLDLYLSARSSGDPEQLEAFDRDWSLLCQYIQDLLNSDPCPLSVRTVRMAQNTSRSIQALSHGFRRVEVRANTLSTNLKKQVDALVKSSASPESPESVSAESSKSATLPFHHVQPLLRFVLDNICFPYPCAADKHSLLEQCAAAGWASVTQRKLEDWLNMARSKMGYALIFKSETIDEDRKVMSNYVRRVLLGSPVDRQGIPPPLVRRIEMMQQWVLNQYESRAAKDQTSLWAHDVIDLVQRLGVPDSVRPDAADVDLDGDLSSDSEYDSEEFDSSDSDTLYSDTDAGDDDHAPHLVGVKPIYSGLGLGQPPARTVLRTSSSSSLSSHSTLADIAERDSSGTGCTIAQSDDEHDSDRPAKRRRSSLDGSLDPETSATRTTVSAHPPAKAQLAEQPSRSQKRKRSLSKDDSRPPPALATVAETLPARQPLTEQPYRSQKRKRSLSDGDSRPPIALATVAKSLPARQPLSGQPYRSQKRKRSRSEDDLRSTPSMRVRELDPPHSIHVPPTALDALASLCQLRWDAASSIVEINVDVDLDWDDDLIAASPLDDDPIVDDLFDEDITSCESPGDTFVDTSFAWCKLQVYVLERMLRHGVHILPSPDASPTEPTPSITVDASLFKPEELAYLSSLSMQDPDVGQACVEPPDLVEPGPNCPGVLGLSPWSADLSDPNTSDGTTLPSVDIDEWITSLLNEPFST